MDNTSESLPAFIERLRPLHDAVYVPEVVFPAHPQALGPMVRPGEKGYTPRESVIVGNTVVIGTTNHSEPLLYVSDYCRSAPLWGRYIVEALNAIHDAFKRRSDASPAAPIAVDYERLVIYRMGPWIWQVHDNQSYLGRMIFRLGRDEDGSLASCSADEWSSLHACMKAYERFIGGLFGPDRINYGQLGNVYPQLHVHAVPRYALPRSWGGVEFRDVLWGSNWAPTPPSPLPSVRIYEFADWLRSRLTEAVKADPARYSA